jgi:hypothetical protein
MRVQIYDFFYRPRNILNFLFMEGLQIIALYNAEEETMEKKQVLLPPFKKKLNGFQGKTSQVV